MFRTEKAAAIASLRQQIASAEAELADVEKSIGITVTNILQTMKPHAVADQKTYVREIENHARLMRRRCELMDLLMVLRVDLAEQLPPASR